jgi:AcrR family transcriptional regulator
MNLDRLTKSPKQGRSRDLSQKILTVAERIIVRDGLDFTVRQVAEEASTSLGGIYGRFTNRDELVHAVLKQVLKRIERRLIVAVSSPEHATLEAMLTAFTRAAATSYKKDGRAVATMIFGAELGEVHRAAIQSREAVYHALRDAALRFRAEIKRPDVDVAVRVAMEMVLATLSRHKQLERDIIIAASDHDMIAREVGLGVRAYLTTP